MSWLLWIAGGLVLAVGLMAAIGAMLPVRHRATRRARYRASPDALYAVLAGPARLAHRSQELRRAPRVRWPCGGGGRRIATARRSLSSWRRRSLRSGCGCESRIRAAFWRDVDVRHRAGRGWWLGAAGNRRWRSLQRDLPIHGAVLLRVPREHRYLFARLGREVRAGCGDRGVTWDRKSSAACATETGAGREGVSRNGLSVVPGRRAGQDCVSRFDVGAGLRWAAAAGLLGRSRGAGTREGGGKWAEKILHPPSRLDNSV